MSTKLEDMVDLLAGREVAPGLLDELDDPSSEASRFLEATRNRSRAILGRPGPDGPSTARRPDLRWMVALGVAAVLFALGVTLWAVAARFRHLEANLGRLESESREASRRADVAFARLLEPKPPAPPVVLPASAPALSPTPAVPDAIGPAIARLEAGLARIAAADRGADPTVERIREDLATIRHGLAAEEKAGARRLEELLAANHEVARLLRLLINRNGPGIPIPAPVPPPHDPAPARQVPKENRTSRMD